MRNEDTGIKVERCAEGLRIDASDAIRAMEAFPHALERLKSAWLAIPRDLRRRVGDVTFTLRADGEVVHDLDLERITRADP